MANLPWYMRNKTILGYLSNPVGTVGSQTVRIVGSGVSSAVKKAVKSATPQVSYIQPNPIIGDKFGMYPAARIAGTNKFLTFGNPTLFTDFLYGTTPGSSPINKVGQPVGLPQLQVVRQRADFLAGVAGSATYKQPIIQQDFGQYVERIKGQNIVIDVPSPQITVQYPNIPSLVGGEDTTTSGNFFDRYKWWILTGGILFIVYTFAQNKGGIGRNVTVGI